MLRVLRPPPPPPPPLQADRKAQLLAGLPWAMATASAADLDALSPAELDSLSALARAQLLAGSQLARQLRLGVTAGEEDEGRRLSQPLPAGLLQVVWELPEKDRAALAWVLLASAGSGGAQPEQASDR